MMWSDEDKESQIAKIDHHASSRIESSNWNHQTKRHALMQKFDRKTNPKNQRSRQALNNRSRIIRRKSWKQKSSSEESFEPKSKLTYTKTTVFRTPKSASISCVDHAKSFEESSKQNSLNQGGGKQTKTEAAAQEKGVLREWKGIRQWFHLQNEITKPFGFHYFLNFARGRGCQIPSFCDFGAKTSIEPFVSVVACSVAGSDDPRIHNRLQLMYPGPSAPKSGTAG